MFNVQTTQKTCPGKIMNQKYLREGLANKTRSYPNAIKSTYSSKTGSWGSREIAFPTPVSLLVQPALSAAITLGPLDLVPPGIWSFLDFYGVFLLLFASHETLQNCRMSQVGRAKDHRLQLPFVHMTTSTLGERGIFEISILSLSQAERGNSIRNWCERESKLHKPCFQKNNPGKSPSRDRYTHYST